jgi:uncharacterized membrane protein YeaQ/YmgE (transglycosylase-associated protein family)
MWGILAGVIVGGLAGWVASKIMGTDEQMGCFLNVIVGVVGAFIGGLIVELLTGAEFELGFSLWSFLVAIVGAVILLAIVGWIRGRGRV